MQDIPDVIGEKISDAELLLKNQGFDKLKVIVTSPPWPGKGQGDLLVIRQRLKANNVIELVICAEDYQR